MFSDITDRFVLQGHCLCAMHVKRAPFDCCASHHCVSSEPFEKSNLRLTTNTGVEIPQYDSNSNRPTGRVYRQEVEALENNVSGSSASEEERYFTVNEVAKLWKLSDDTIVRIFARESGVLILTRVPKGSRRTYRTLRIPLSVLERVRHRLTNP